MTDDKNCPHCGSAAEIVRARQPISRLHSVISNYRDAYHDGHSMAGMGDAITMVSVILGVLAVVMFLAVASKDGLSAFVGGVLAGGVAGVLLWSYGSQWSLSIRRFKARARAQYLAHLPIER